MDKTDLLILKLLEENAKIDTQDLAIMTEIPTVEAESRIKVMEKEGIIRRYSAVINWEQTGYTPVLAVLDLKVSPERDFGYDRIADRIARFSEVKALRLVTGAYDLEVLVSGKSMQEIARFVAEHIAPMDRIRETATHIVMKVYKENGDIFFEREVGERLPFSF